MLFSEPATAASLDEYTSNSATLNVGSRAVDNVANYIAGETPISSEGGLMECPTGFVSLQAQSDGLENGAACAFARSLSSATSSSVQTLMMILVEIIWTVQSQKRVTQTHLVHPCHVFKTLATENGGKNVPDVLTCVCIK